MALTEKRKKHLEQHGHKPLGDGPLDKVPVSVRLPANLADYVQTQAAMFGIPT